MLLFSVLASVVVGLLAGLLPAVGTEPEQGAKPTIGSTLDPLSSPHGSNCSHLTLKLEFSSEVVEHGENTSSS